MTDIDASKIKPGDTVRYQYQDADMKAAGIVPKESAGQVYTIEGLPCVDGYVLEYGDDLTVLERIPARPDWADALVVRDKDGDPWALFQSGFARFGKESTGPVRDWQTLEHHHGPITVVLDADGNPPEPEWLDAEALDKLPSESIAICQYPDAWPRVKCHDGKWQHTGLVLSSERFDSRAVAPARVLWTPEADR